jgi:hypothetical protein
LNRGDSELLNDAEVQLFGYFCLKPCIMYRQIITPDKAKFTITFPEEFIGKEVEVIAFTLKEAVQNTDTTGIDKKEALEFLKNSTRIDLSNFKFNREEANER